MASGRAGLPRILVIDDDGDFTDVLRMLLEDAGYLCRTLSSGDSLMAELATFSPSLVILDICLPGQSGYSLCWEIKRSGGGDLPVVLLSGKAGKADRKLGLAMGADAYLAKPFDGALLVALIGSLVGAWAQMQPGAALCS